MKSFDFKVGDSVYKRQMKNVLFFNFLVLPQGQGHHNSMSQLLWARSTYLTLSTFPVGGNRSTRRKPTTFGRALTLLFSHEDWVRRFEIGGLKLKPGLSSSCNRFSPWLKLLLTLLTHRSTILSCFIYFSLFSKHRSRSV